MTTAVLAFLIVGCLIFIAAIVWLLRPRREPKPEPMEYQEPRDDAHLGRQQHQQGAIT